MWKLLTVGWLLLPAVFAIWRCGPGHDAARGDEAAAAIRAARQAADGGDWDAAVAAYADALGHVPNDRVADRRRLRLAQALAKLRGATFAEGRDELARLVDEFEEGPNPDAEGRDAARAALAHSRFHTAWLMRLEGRPRSDWEPEVEAARQWFRVSVEEALARGDPAAAARLQEDLESTVRMARANLADLQAMNLPDELRGSKSESDGEGKGKGKGNGKGKGKGKGQGDGEGPADEANDARTGSAGPPPDNTGH